MPELLLVNPRRKRRARSGTKRRRHMTALQRQYFGGKGKRRRSRSRRRAVALSSGAVAVRRGRRHHSRVGTRARRHARAFRRRAASSFRGFNINSFMKGTMIPSFVGAAGAIGVDVLIGYISPNLPATLTQGTAMPALVRVAGAVGLGMVAGMVTKSRAVGEQVTAGAVTVVVYNLVKNMVKTNFPTLPLSGVGEYVSGMGYAGPALAYPDVSRLGMYVPGATQPNYAAIAAAAAASRKIVQPSGMHGLTEYTEGGFVYQ